MQIIPKNISAKRQGCKIAKVRYIPEGTKVKINKGSVIIWAVRDEIGLDNKNEHHYQSREKPPNG